MVSKSLANLTKSVGFKLLEFTNINLIDNSQDFLLPRYVQNFECAFAN